MPYTSFVLDGELVVLDDTGKPSFQKLQQRVRPRLRPEGTSPGSLSVTMLVFDLISFEDFDLRRLPLSERKKLLRRLLPRDGALRYADHIGLKIVHKSLLEFQKQHGDFFKPAALIEKLVSEGKGFKDL